MPKSQSLAKKTGDFGEQVAEIALRSLGLQMVRKIETGWKVIRWVNAREHIAVVFPNRAVMGDFTALTRSGKGVLVEVKTLPHNLRISDFATHQVETLNEFSMYGIVLIVYVYGDGYSVIQWPIPDFGPGHGLTPARAKELEINEPFS